MSFLEKENISLKEQLDEIREKNVTLEVQVQEIPQLKLKVNFFNTIYIYKL